MATVATFTGDIDVTGNLKVRGTFTNSIDRSNLTQESLAEYVVPLSRGRVWDARQTNLPSAGATDDLGYVTGTLGTDFPCLQTGDLKAAGATTRYAGFTVSLPPEYVAGETIVLRVSGGMLTTVSDGTATVDCEAYPNDEDATVSADICTTAATTINSLTFADVDFTLTPTSRNPGDEIDIRLAVAVNDAATGTAVIGALGKISLLCDIKG